MVLRELEQAIIVSFLAANEHPYSRKTDRPAARRSAAPGSASRKNSSKRIGARPITIEKLVEATGISARVLFRAFRQHRGCTPMEFAKQVRLQRARQMLSSPGHRSPRWPSPAASFSTGHFARAYREAFGELPSETIRRSADSILLSVVCARQ